MYKGNKFLWKYKPLNIFEVAESMNYLSFLSDKQKFILEDLWGLDPEEYPTNWNQAIVLIGQRGGKRTLQKIIVKYINEIIKSIPDPHTYFDYYSEVIKPPFVNIETSNNSISSMNDQSTARKAFAHCMKNMYDKNYLTLHSLGEDINTIEGKNLLLAMMSGVHMASTQKTYDNAKLIWERLNANTQATYPNNVGKVIMFSYLNNSKHDLAHELSKEETLYRKVYRFSSYETNPCVELTNPLIVERYQENYKSAKARYECIKL